jgi:ubiquinone/menaquinone biosynthesis C-methylase UbiE
VRTDSKTLNRHYADFYAQDPRIAWRELGALEKARSVGLLVARPVGRVVDIGCGEGSVIAALDGSLGAAGFSGFEVAEAAVEAARRRQYDARVEFALFDGRRIPSEDKAFDVAILSHVLEHVADPRALLHEAARVASPSRSRSSFISGHVAFAGTTRATSTSSTVARSATSSKDAACGSSASGSTAPGGTCTCSWAVAAGRRSGP